MAHRLLLASSFVLLLPKQSFKDSGTLTLAYKTLHRRMRLYVDDFMLCTTEGQGIPLNNFLTAYPPFLSI